MISAIASREILTLHAGGVRLLGTYHKPQGRTQTEATNPPAILFLNPATLPRTAGGDSAVYWADSAAKSGFPAFRFDLPGLGDSDGTSFDTGDCRIDHGGYGPVLSAIADQIVERFHLPGVVVVGHCAGATTALYAAASNSRFFGIVLLDPYFYVQQDSTVRTVQHVVGNWQARILKTLVGSQPGDSKFGAAALKLLSWLRGIYRSVNRSRLFVRRKTLPDNANLPLIRCWTQLAAAGVRMLVLRSPSTTPTAGEFDYIGYLRSLSNNGRISFHLLEGATHAFAERTGRDAVREHVEQWLCAHFSSRPAPRVDATTLSPAVATAL